MRGWVLAALAALSAPAAIGEPLPSGCAVCADVDRVVELMRETVRRHAVAKNAQLVTVLGTDLGASCQPHPTRALVICTARMPATGEDWRLAVRLPDEAPGQEPYRVTLRIEFPALRPEPVGAFTPAVFPAWRPRYQESCRHEVWQPGPLPRTLLLAQVQGRFEAGCLDRVETIELYLVSSSTAAPAPRIY
jgi:hypothetical protein